MNYRGISLLPVVSKIFTGLLASWVGGFLEVHNLLANEQNGFKPGRSCSDHVYTLNELLRTRKSQCLETFCSFVDFQKAFDYVNHDYLLHKLLQKGIDGKMYHIIKNIYSALESCVLVGDRLTSWLQAKSGVRQGDSLSPILFAIFIDDLAYELIDAKSGLDIDNTHLALLVYADHVMLISGSHSKAQEGLDIMSRWCTAWGMKVNIKMSQAVHHRNPQCKRHPVPLVLCGA